MKLVHPDLETELDFQDGCSILMVVENPKTFRSFIGDLVAQVGGNDGEFVLSEKNKELSISKKSVLIFNPFDYSCFDKSIQTKLNSDLKTFLLGEQHHIATLNLISQIAVFCDNVIADYDYPISYEETDVASLVKLLGFQVQMDYDSELSKIREYINILKNLCGIDLFVFVNLCDYFSVEEIDLLISECQSDKEALLIIQSHQPYQNPKETKVVIIDFDNCQIF